MIDTQPSRFTSEQCQVQADGTVVHRMCHTYVDGTITDPSKPLDQYIRVGAVRA